MKSTFYRSPAIFVIESTQVGECVQLMREHNVSSVLVVGAGKQRELVGIFTERDLLKTVHHSADGGYWSLPVSKVMTRHVKAIEVSELPKAGVLMLKHGFRNLPIIVKDKKGNSQIVGVLTMKDLVLNLLKNRTRSVFQKVLFPKISTIVRSSIAVVTADPYLLRLLEEGFPESAGLEIRHLSIDDLLSSKGTKPITQHINAVLIDLDDLEPQRWENLLRQLGAEPNSPPLIVTLRGDHHNIDEVRVLSELAKTKGIAVFSKPISIAALFAHVLRILR